MIVNSTVTFGFLVEGDFSAGQFKANLDDTLNMFQRDIKRKSNKLAITRKMHNYTAVESGDNEMYLHIEDVQCALNDACVSTRKQEDCETIQCNSVLHRDAGTSAAEAEHLYLTSASLFFQLGFYDGFEHFSYLGPWVDNTTIPMEMIGTPPFHMGDNEMRSFSRIFSDFLIFSQIDPTMKINEVQIAKQNIIVHPGTEIFEDPTAAQARIRKSVTGNTYVSEIVTNIYTLHRSPVARSFSKDLNAYFERNIEELLSQIQTDKNLPQYFHALVDIRGSNYVHEPETEILDDVINNVVNERGEIHIVYGMLGIFFIVISLTVSFIIQKKRADNYFQTRGEGKFAHGDPTESLNALDCAL